MPEHVIRQLVRFGAEAGEMLKTQFQFDDHRWLRFLVAMARMEQTLDELDRSLWRRRRRGRSARS